MVVPPHLKLPPVIDEAPSGKKGKLAIISERRSNPVQFMIWAREKYGDVFTLDMEMGSYDAATLINSYIYIDTHIDTHKFKSYICTRTQIPGHFPSLLLPCIIFFRMPTH